MKKVVVLGSTGSIGEQALEVIQAAGDELELVGISAHSSWERACEQARKLGVERIAIGRPRRGRALRRRASGRARGRRGRARADRDSDADVVLNAITGSAGLGPTIVALTEGIDLALANKESLVVGGELVTALAEATDARSSRSTPSTPRSTS